MMTIREHLSHQPTGPLMLKVRRQIEEERAAEAKLLQVKVPSGATIPAGLECGNIIEYTTK